MTQTRSTSKHKVKLNLKRAKQLYKNADGKVVPSVTTVLGILDKPALVAWAYNQGLAGLDYRKTSGEACDIGTIAHAMCECYVKGEELDTSDLDPALVSKAENAFLKFMEWWDSKGLTLVASELRMVSEYYQVGGTLDLLARTPEGKLILVDLKTSKAIYKEYRIQVAAYAELYKETHEEAIIDEEWIVRIGKEDAGDFEAVLIEDSTRCFECFESLRETYRTYKAINP